MAPRTARAAVYDAPNTPFVVRRYPLRDARRDEVLVRVTMSTICRSDIHSYHGHRPNPCPGILGHEIIGVIDQLGADIETDLRGDPVAVGDRITWTEYFHHGPSYYREVHDLPQKSPGVRKYGHDLVADDPHFLGGFAEYCYVLPGTGILKLPEDLSDEEATPINCGVAHRRRDHGGGADRDGRRRGRPGAGLAGAVRVRDRQDARRPAGDRPGRRGRPPGGGQAVRRRMPRSMSRAATGTTWWPRCGSWRRRTAWTR